MTFAHCPNSVNVGGSASAPAHPAEAPPPCPECLDECVWCLNATGTGYLPVCAWCSAYELPEGDDFDHDADTVCEPTPLEPRKGGASNG